MGLSLVKSLGDLPPGALAALASPDYPFTEPEFLLALEGSGSVDSESGWRSLHLTTTDNEGTLSGLMLAYVKAHSYGEYVFDWEWARFFHANGASYYPKLLTAIPFTPATGPRLLLAPNADGATKASLIAAAAEIARAAGMSSYHALFLDELDAAAFRQAGFAERYGCQFHWRNDGYRDFQDFLDALTGKRRRDIQRERRRANEHGLILEDLAGEQLTDRHAEAMERLYLATIDRKEAIAYLQPGFFQRLFRTMPDRILMTAARRGDEIVAAAFNMFKGRHLYGRYWGSTGEFQDLHFELCYYRTIAFAISRGMTLVEAGAQGEHKIQRGFLPSLTRSAHLIFDQTLAGPVAAFLAKERQDVEARVAALSAHGPFAAGRL